MEKKEVKEKEKQKEDRRIGGFRAGVGFCEVDEL